MVSLLKIFFIALIIVFLDLLIQGLFNVGNQIVVQNMEFTLIGLVLLIFELVATFLLIIVHAITHIFDVNLVIQDLYLMLYGFLAIIFFFIGGSTELILHFFRLPFNAFFNFIGKDFGTGIWLSIPFIFDLQLDLKTLSFVLFFPNIYEVGLEIAGVELKLTVRNAIGFSFFGYDDYMKLYLVGWSATNDFGLGNIAYSPYFLINNVEPIAFLLHPEVYFLGAIEIKGSVTIPFTDIKIGAGVDEEIKWEMPYPKEFESFSFITILDSIIESIGIQKLDEWIDSVYKEIAPDLSPDVSVMLLELVKVKKFV